MPTGGKGHIGAILSDFLTRYSVIVSRDSGLSSLSDMKQRIDLPEWTGKNPYGNYLSLV